MRAWLVAAGAVCAISAIAWAACVLQAEAGRTWRALLVAFLLFAPLSAGMVVWSAIVLLAHGRWAGGLERFALIGLGFAPVSLLVFAALAFGGRSWASWMHEGHLPQGFWLSSPFLFIRDGAGLVMFWLLAWWYVRQRVGGKVPVRLAGVLVLAFCVVFSLIGFDMVMALAPHWHSTLFGGYFFVSAAYAGLAAWVVSAALGQPAISPARLSDLGKLLVAFSILTTYLMYSHLLPIWYENMTHETSFVLPRLRTTDWRFVSVVLLGSIYLGPLVVLLTRWSKKTQPFFGGVAAAVLAGMWIERWWLVGPTVGAGPRFGLPELSAILALVSAFVISMMLAHRRIGQPVFAHPPLTTERDDAVTR